jgi:hypothetical protein
MMDIDLSMRMVGKFDLSERIEAGDSDAETFKSESILPEYKDDIELRIGFTDDENSRDDIGFYIDVSKYHMVNAETKRVFHCAVSLQPKHEELRRLHDFLGFLLATGCDTAK